MEILGNAEPSQGCVYSNLSFGNKKCSFCNDHLFDNTEHSIIEKMKKQGEANNTNAFYALGRQYALGCTSLRPDWNNKTIEI